MPQRVRMGLVASAGQLPAVGQSFVFRMGIVDWEALVTARDADGTVHITTATVIGNQNMFKLKPAQGWWFAAGD